METERVYELKNIPVTHREDLFKESIRLSKTSDQVSQGFDLARKLYLYRSLHPSQIRNRPVQIDKYLVSETKAKENPYLPTIGLELEIPNKATDLKSFLHEQLAKELGIRIAGSSQDVSSYFEFSLPYSYSPRTQALLLHLLLELGYIPSKEIVEPTKSDTWSRRREIPFQPSFSLHYNLGIPQRIRVDELPKFKDDATKLAIACGLAYTSVQRLSTRKQERCVSVDRESFESIKNPERNNYGRVEITTLGIGTLPTYRQLYQIQDLGAAFFAYHSLSTNWSNMNSQEIELARLWEDGSDYINKLLSQYGATTEIFTSGRRELIGFLGENALKQRMQVYLPRLAWDIHNVIYRNSD